MRILFATTLSAIWGGSEWLWAETALQLAHDGHTVAFALPWHKPHPLLDQLRQARVHEYAALRPLRWYRRWWRRLVPVREFERHVTSDFAPDVAVLSQSRFDQGVAWLETWAAAGIPHAALVQLVDENAYVEESQLNRIAAAFTKTRRVYFVSAGNHHQLEVILARRLDRAKVVRNPVRAPLDTPFTWPAADGTLRLAMAARLDPIHKGHDILFEVLARPVWQKRALELHLYGEGEAEPRLRRLQTMLGLKRVVFAGHVKDPADIWAHCHVAAVPSRCEGLPVAMVEAMLQGRPVFGTAVAGIPEFVNDGVHGFLASGCTPDLLDQALERLWQARDRLPDLGRAAQLQARALLPENPVTAFAREVTSLRAA